MRQLTPLLAVLAAVTVAGWLLLRPQDDVRRMQSLSPALLAEQQRIAALTARGAEAQFFAVGAGSDDAALEREEALIAQLQPLLGRGLDGFEAPAQFVPSAARQRANRALVNTLDGDPMRRQAERLGFTPITEAPGDDAPVLTLAQALAGPFGFLSVMVLPPVDGQVLHLVPLEGVHRADLLVQAAAGIDGVRFIDPARDFSALLGHYRARAVWLLVLSAGLMVPLLAWRYGWRRGLLVMLPPTLAVLLAPALRALGGGGFSFFDAMAQVLVLSIGVDYAVFCAETTPERRAVTMLAVVLAALAALLSFGLLALSGAAAVHGFGVTMTLGIGAAFLLAPLARIGGGGAAVVHRGGHWAVLAERGAWWGLVFVSSCYQLLGRRVCLAVLRPIVLYFYLAGGRRRRWVHAYLARVARTRDRQYRPWLDGWRINLNFAERALDNFIALAHPERVGPIQVTGGEAMLAHARAGGGGLIIVSHHGNVDVSRFTLANRLDLVVNVLLHTRNAVRYNELLRRIRPEHAARCIEVSEIGPATAIDLLERVERGEWIAIAGDRPPLSGDTRVSRALFLGEPAPFGQGPYILAALLHCPVMLLFCVRRGDGHEITLESFAPRIKLAGRDKDATLAHWVRAYAARLAEHCLEEPLQWYNFFDFWAEDGTTIAGRGVAAGPDGVHVNAPAARGPARHARSGLGNDAAAHE